MTKCKNVDCENPVFTTNDPYGNLYVDEQCLECLKWEDHEHELEQASLDNVDESDSERWGGHPY